MSDLQRVGPVNGGSGTAPPFTASITGAQRVSDAHARYMNAVLEGRVFMLPFTAAGPTAYVGAAGGTPLACAHNPAGSNKILIPLFATLAGRAQASAAGQTGLNIWAGPSVLPTGTLTVPTSMLSMLPGGAMAKGFVNTALTGSTALALAAALWTYYWATAAGAIQAPGFFDLGGCPAVVPGNQIALGLSVALTSATYDGTLVWEEVPNLAQA